MKRFSSALLILILLLAPAAGAFAIDFFVEGERLFRENKPAEAAPLLLQASSQENTDPRVFVYLGLCYQLLGRYDDAVTTFMKGTSARGSDKRILFLNAGNVYYLSESFTEADQMYTRAIAADTAYAPPYLNRANSRLKLEQIENALADYSMYLILDPASPQKTQIQQLMALLSGEITARQEAARLAAEALKASEEEKARLALEAAERAARLEAERLAAAERYKKLLDEVSSSLQSVDEATTLSAGSENLMEYNEEGELE